MAEEIEKRRKKTKTKSQQEIPAADSEVLGEASEESADGGSSLSASEKKHIKSLAAQAFESFNFLSDSADENQTTSEALKSVRETVEHEALEEKAPPATRKNRKTKKSSETMKASEDEENLQNKGTPPNLSESAAELAALASVFDQEPVQTSTAEVAEVPSLDSANNEEVIPQEEVALALESEIVEVGTDEITGRFVEEVEPGTEVSFTGESEPSFVDSHNSEILASEAEASAVLEEEVKTDTEALEASETTDENDKPEDHRRHLSEDELEALEEVEEREAREEAYQSEQQEEELPEYTASDVEGSELENFESAEIEEKLFIEDQQAESIIESLLFASDKPVSMTTLRELFKDTNIEKAHIKRILDRLAVEYAGASRGVVLEEVTGGFQLRTKVDNMNFLRRLLKGRSFKLSGPALEVLSIVAYKQPVIKSEIDEIRGVESGHLLRALMEKGLVNFEGKSDMPGRPMQYATTKKFLEIFGLRNLKELPTLSQIDELLPEGIGAEDEKKEKLSDITDSMAQAITGTYSEGEEELEKIQGELQTVDTTTAFFEEEKKRMKDEENRQRAQDIREAIAVGEQVDSKDMKWLAKYEAEQAALTAQGQF